MEEWVPPEKREPAWYICFKLFDCRVSHIQALSIEHIKQFGTVTTGIPSMDRDMANAMVTRMLPIDKMAEYYDQGITVAIVRVEDTKEIYDRITDHLNYWKNALRNNLPLKAAPTDDLIKLDKFAQAVYKYAAPQFTTEVIESILSSRLSSLAGLSMGEFKPPEPVVEGVDPNEHIPAYIQNKRVSMADMFRHEAAVTEGGFKWRK
jgi:hypothetical protein